MISMEINVQQILRKQHYANLCDYILVFKPPLKLLLATEKVILLVINIINTFSSFPREPGEEWNQCLGGCSRTRCRCRLPQ